MQGPLPRYLDLVAAGTLAPDAAQLAAAERLQALSAALQAKERAFFARKPALARGLYLWGGVGRGKSLLLDVFFNNSDVAPKRRIHFHEFMAETHERIAAWRSADERTRRRHAGANPRSIDDPMPPVAADIAAGAALLCFDEFQVTDIADAMLLGRLFEALFAKGVVIVATSNRHPDDLYKDGLNRQLFLPFIALLKERLDVFFLDAERDYRLDQLTGVPVYHWPLGPEADAAMDRAWTAMIAGSREKPETLTVKGREVVAPRTARGLARFTFDDLCRAALGASDYLAIARRYGTVFLDRVPEMSPEDRNEARRFTFLIDAFYETRTKLVCSAAARPSDLYRLGSGAFEFERTASRLAEMQTEAYLAAEHAPPGNVASASATTR
ncbi:MAG: cell division protein ZapE [Parvularculaceae bacterium]|nr:cell division protein ZapE [Parvularculaceae bacterium]